MSVSYKNLTDGKIVIFPDIYVDPPHVKLKKQVKRIGDSTKRQEHFPPSETIKLNIPLSFGMPKPSGQTPEMIADRQFNYLYSYVFTGKSQEYELWRALCNREVIESDHTTSKQKMLMLDRMREMSDLRYLRLKGGQYPN